MLACGLRQVGSRLGPGGSAGFGLPRVRPGGSGLVAGGGRVCVCPYPGLSACAASSVPATGLSLRSPGLARDLSRPRALLCAGFAGAVPVFWPAGKHLGLPGPAGVTGPFLRGAGI